VLGTRFAGFKLVVIGIILKQQLDAPEGAAPGVSSKA
jgi:hypothetical protein